MIAARARLVAAMVVFAASLSAAEGDGFTSIFNGKDLTGWDGAEGFWRVEDGAIVGQTTPDHPLPHHSYIIWRGGDVKDFELRIDFRLTGGVANSGVQYRSRDLGDHEVAGYQANMELKHGNNGVLEEMKTGRGGHLASAGQRVRIKADGSHEVLGSTADPAAIEMVAHNPGWNTMVIIARGNHLIHQINGVTIIDAVDEQTGKSAASGILSLQLHIGKPMKAEFRNIRLKTLTD